MFFMLLEGVTQVSIGGRKYSVEFFRSFSACSLNAIYVLTHVLEVAIGDVRPDEELNGLRVGFEPIDVIITVFSKLFEVFMCVSRQEVWPDAEVFPFRNVLVIDGLL